MGKHTYQYKRVHKPPIRALASRFLMLLVYDKLCNCHMEMLVAFNGLANTRSFLLSTPGEGRISILGDLEHDPG